MIHLFAVLAFSSVAFAQTKIPVSVYYESLCPDSIKFITTQLYPVWNSPLATYMDLKLVPFGKSSVTRDGEMYKFECHHGPKECEGNKVQSCALKELPMDQGVKFVNCVMAAVRDRKDQEYPGMKCADELKISYDAINKCANSTDGDKLLADMENETKKFQDKLTNVPSVSFYGKYSKADQERAVKNFREALCSKISGTKPAECATENGASTLTSVATIMVPLAAVYISRLI